jgi:hypothetical protein
MSGLAATCGGFAGMVGAGSAAFAVTATAETNAVLKTTALNNFII